MYQRILVPIDGSPTSLAGLDEAIRAASLSLARLRLLHVVDVLAFASGFETFAASDAEQVLRLAPVPVLLVRSPEDEAANAAREGKAYATQ
jgi:nucleotide-binding universal stress UspA family protein